jgi:cbb3-type cytochrome oxidase subunit 3
LLIVIGLPILGYNIYGMWKEAKEEYAAEQNAIILEAEK